MPNYLRAALIFSTPLNLFGGVLLSPLWPPAWSPPGTIVAHPLHAWIISSFVFGFGLAYGWMAWKNEPNHLLIALAAYGKSCFVLAMYSQAALGEIPWTVGATATPDLILAAVFATFLWLDRGS
ncbi:MAG: hypothetical protein KC912_09995 [Proteobacteria bacterium]|nr:hypothetical protein [Pseudomonadota bacterium]